MSILTTLDDRLAPAEKLFFTWLVRVFAAATLVGCAWIDDAPPLDIAAMLIGLYVAVRVATQFEAFAAAAPFENRTLKATCALVCLLLLGLSFLAIATFVDNIAAFMAG
jgi:hypothetical protein